MYQPLLLPLLTELLREELSKVRKLFPPTDRRRTDFWTAA